MVDASETPEQELNRLRTRVRELEGLHGIGPGAVPLGHGLIEREALMREAERIASLGSWVWDVPDKRISWSAQMFRVLGYEPDSIEPSAEAFFACVHPDDRSIVEANGARIAAGDAPPGGRSDRARIVRPDGSIRSVELGGHALHGPDGAPRRIVGTVRDITHELETARALDDAQTMLTAIGDMAGLGTWMWDPSKDHLEWSPGLRRLLGLPHDLPASIQQFMQRVHPDDVGALRESTSEVMGPNPVAIPTTFRIIRDGETRHIFHHTSKLTHREDTPVRLVGLLLDITERQNLEDQLRQSQKLEAVGALANGICHDFNNYLMIANANIELIALDLDPADPNHELLEEILAATERCHLLIQRLLAFSRKQVPRPTVFAVNPLIEDFAALASRLIGDMVELSFELDPDAGAIHAERTQLEQVLVNLAINARDAMPEGGRLTISSERVLLDALRAAQLPPLSPGPHLRLEVADTGMGIPADIQARVFEPFFTTKADGKGSGLGLSTTFAIVKQAGGSLNLHSELGEGTRFEIFLPSAQ